MSAQNMTGFKLKLETKAKNAHLRNTRKQLGWTQRELAKYLNEHTERDGIHHHEISSWECLRDYPRNADVRDTLAKLCGVSESELFPQFVRSPEFLRLPKSAERDFAVDRSLGDAGEQYYLVDAAGRKRPLLLPATQRSIEQDIETDELNALVREGIDEVLDPQQREVLTLYYDLGDAREMTLEEIGELLGITRERVRLIRDRAFEELSTWLVDRNPELGPIFKRCRWRERYETNA